MKPVSLDDVRKHKTSNKDDLLLVLDALRERVEDGRVTGFLAVAFEPDDDDPDFLTMYQAAPGRSKLEVKGAIMTLIENYNDTNDNGDAIT